MIYAVFAAAFVLTQAVEMGAAYLLWGGRRSLYPVFVCNLLTNPAVNLLLWLAVGVFGMGAYWWALGSLECAAVAAEAFALRRMLGLGMKKAALMSLSLNAASYIAGSVMQLLVF